jgi:hypothetical protein
MSRNLCQRNCEFCPGVPTFDEKPRPITEADAGRYFPEYKGMLVANATCPLCEAKYLAWVDEAPRDTGWSVFRRPSEDEPFVDLSFRSTFNDEPGDDDLPKWRIETQHIRVGPWVPR